MDVQNASPKLNSSTNDWWSQLLPFAGVAAVYLAFPTKNYFFDGIAFAQIIEDVPGISASLLHPNHLIYNVIGAVFYRMLLAVGVTVRAVTALQILNSILSAVSAYVLFLILRRALCSRYVCYALTLLFAFSATWWKFSTDADAYIPSILFLLISFYVVLPNNKPRPILLALVYSMSLCFHQISIVFFPVLPIGLYLQDSYLSRRSRLIRSLVFCLATGLITIGAYCYSFYLLTGGLHFASFIRWTMSYAPDESFGFHAWNNLVFTLRGHVRLFFGGRLNAIAGLMNPIVIGLIVVLLLIVILLVYTTIRYAKRPHLRWIKVIRSNPTQRTMVLLCILWILLYVTFLFFLLAHHTFYRMFYLPAIIILLGLAIDTHKSQGTPRRHRLALLVAALALTNFITLIYPYSHAQKYPPLVFAMELNKVWTRGTVIYYAQTNSDLSLVRYFNPGMEWRQFDPQAIEDEMFRVGGPVWLETTAILQLSTPPGRVWLTNCVTQLDRHSLNTKAHYIEFIQIAPRERSPTSRGFCR